MSRPSQSSDTRDDYEARELTQEVTSTVTASKTRLDEDTTVISAYSQSLIDPVSKVNGNESRLRRERDTALCTVGEQKRKLNNLYTKIGQLWEENDALKENTATSKDQEKSTEELCGACRVKDTEIAQLHEQLDSAAVEAKTDPDEDAAQAGLRIAYFRAEEELRTKDLAHVAEMAKIKEEHGILAARLHEEVRDARTATNKEHAEKLCTQEQLSNITKELSDTKKQLFDSEEQYRILYDIIPKSGGGRMAKPPLPTIPQFSHSGEVESSSPSVPCAFSLVPTEHSHRGHSQDKEASPTPAHISGGSKSSGDQHTLERTRDATRAPTSSTPPKRAIDQVDDAASAARDKHETPAPISKRGPGRPRKVTSTHHTPRTHPPPESETPPTFAVNKRPHKLDQDQSSTQRPKKRRWAGFGPRKPKLSSADDIPWLFCVAGEGEGIRYHTLDDLSPDAQTIVTERFQYWFSASSNAQYNLSDTSHHNEYAKMVKEGNRLANVGAGCVQNMVFAKGRPPKTAKQTGEHEACGSCQNKGSPCVKMILHDGNPVLCWYRQSSGMLSSTTWQDAAYWIRPKSEPVKSTGLAELPIVPLEGWHTVERYALWRCINKWCKENGLDAFALLKFDQTKCSQFAEDIKVDCAARGKVSDRSTHSVYNQIKNALRSLKPTVLNKPITESVDRAEKLKAKIESGDYVSVDERYPEAAIKIPGDDKSDAGL